MAFSGSWLPDSCWWRCAVLHCSPWSLTKETPLDLTGPFAQSQSLQTPPLLISSPAQAPWGCALLMSLPNSHGGTYMLLSLSLCQEHLRGHALCDLYIRPVAWLWFSMWQRGNWDWAVDNLAISGTALGYTPVSLAPNPGSTTHSGSLKLLFLGPVHNLLQNTTQMNTSTR